MLFENHLYLIGTTNCKRKNFEAIESVRYAGMSYEGILMNVDNRGNVYDYIGRCLFKLSSILDIVKIKDGYVVTTNHHKYVFGF